ncbi:TonB-dependent siderophore receptor [Bradyrhizobium sp. LHD-71]|uniref:TonB-dependent siderophore receptor n=1 Tax=Bradyrhizobium sp. LHD-71 TaxID=3072141 RepID=UPI0028106175|nr:TonB-dependent siderophore receptor [Bradyrhizobium sp. LHD-71]MDQ8731841.1 TonB-dependent siderophore receptor [Bradyrhizobium sp. LHD-71]
MNVMKFTQATCLGAVSGLALSVGMDSGAKAQSSPSNLPAVTIDAPVSQQARRVARSANPVRARRASRVAAPTPQPAAPLDPAGGSGPERANGPVQGYVATRSGTGSKTDTPIRELPQTVNVVTADQIREQGAQSVSQALRYTPGVFTETYGTASQFDAYTQIRGFQADFYLDALRLPNGGASTFWASTVTEPYGLERIEVLKGPASGLYGQSTPGGLINMVSKRPTAVPFGEIVGQTGSFGRAQGAFDFGGPIDKEGKFLYRLTGLGRVSDTQVDFMENNRGFIAPAFTWRPTWDTSLTILASHMREWGGKTGFNYLPTSGTLLPNPNGRIPFERYAGEPSFDRFDREQSTIGYAFEHRFNDAVTVRQNLRYFDVQADLKALNRNGELLPDNRTLNRAAFGIDAGAEALVVDNNAEVRFLTGPFAHTALFGVEYRNEDSHYNVGRGFAPPIDIYNPLYGVAIADPGTSNFVRTSSKSDEIGVYAQDQIKFGGFVLTLGGRYDRADATTLNGRTGLSTPQNDDAFTGRVGLNYLFDNGVTPYVSYSTSFRPTIGIDLRGNAYKPTTGQQIEAGVKYQPPGTRTLITASVFDLTQQNRQTADPSLPPQSGSFVQIGEARVRGFELEAKTEVVQGLSLIASYAHLNHEITKSTDPLEIGRRLPQTPVDQAALWAFYEVQDGTFGGLGFGGGVRYVGETWDVTNTRVVPDYALFDARVQYDFGRLSPQLKGTMLSVNALNLADKYYVSQCTFGQGCTLGTRRTILATLSYRW